MLIKLKGIFFILFLLVFALPLTCYAQVEKGNAFQTTAEILSFVNIVLIVTSLISIKQYFWPGDRNTTPFHVFNIIFVIVFYTISFSFLISNKRYYEGYENLSNWSCIAKTFFSTDIYSFAQWVIVLGFVLNIAYIIKYSREYYINS